jgi:hypothetical protein
MGELHNVITFDGGGTVGWSWVSIRKTAFMQRDEMILPNIVEWLCGEWYGSRHDQIRQAVELVRQVRYAEQPFSFIDAVAEDFEFMQTLGGNDLLLPVEFNAVLDWELERNFNFRLQKQKRSLRTGVTPDRLKRMGFPPIIDGVTKKNWTTTGIGKDAFAAMQHNITWLRRTKERSKRRPWQ